MPLHSLDRKDLRDLCQREIEALELWLRRLIDEVLADAYGSDYVNATNEHGDYLFKKEVRKRVSSYLKAEPDRYARPVDTLKFEHLIYIVCKHWDHFEPALEKAFPDGREEARTFLDRIVQPRNSLAHSHPISVRQAEQVICYSHDVIDSLKAYYAERNMEKEYDVPTIVRFTDSFGHDVHSSELLNRSFSDVKTLNYKDETPAHLRPGDKISLEVEVDPSYDPDDYEIRWSHDKQETRWKDGEPLNYSLGRKHVIEIKEKHVDETFSVNVRVVTKRKWHRWGSYDDRIIVYYKVLPPVQQG